MNGRGRQGGPLAAGVGGNCVCPECGHKVKHTRGRPCHNRNCSVCGSKMIRE